MPDATAPSRRLFLGLLAGAPALTALTGVASASAPPATPGPTPPAPEQVAGALADVVRLRFGGQLDDAALAEIREGLANAQRTAARLREVKLGNGDEPVTVFEARPPAARG